MERLHCHLRGGHSVSDQRGGRWELWGFDWFGRVLDVFFFFFLNVIFFLWFLVGFGCLIGGFWLFDWWVLVGFGGFWFVCLTLGLLLGVMFLDF